MGRKNLAQARKSKTVTEFTDYGMVHSRKRLEAEGFHPSVTDLSIPAAVQAWVAMTERTRTPVSDRITRAFLLMREQQEVESMDIDDLSQFEKIITAQGVGPRIATHVLAGGHTSSLSLALVSKRLWAIVSATINYFDFFAGRLQNLGPSAVFVATAPQFTIREMLETRATDPYGLQSQKPFTDWHNSAITREEDIINSLFMVRSRIGFATEHLASSRPKAKQKQKQKLQLQVPQFLKEIFDAKTLGTIQKISDEKDAWRVNQFSSPTKDLVFEPQMIYAATHLQLLLLQIFSQRKHIQVLHLQKIPLFDRRMLAVVLRACPRVTMLGVYDCPLIHFGDLIPILDLIHEINEERKTNALPLIEAFDFFPYFHQGLTYPGNQPGPVFGLSAEGIDLDIMQRALYGILLKGSLKARQMNLDLLFEAGKALRAFLFQLPTPPLSMLTFFDGLYRYLEAEPESNAQKQALYDILKPIRLGIEQTLENDFPSWYIEEMGQYLVFCSSCGYEMLFELFPAGSRRVSPHRRICAACGLQGLLDSEPHDMRPFKVAALDKLFPNWNGKDFNKDAPISSGGPERGLMRLKSIKTIRNNQSPLHVNATGVLVATPHTIELLRDNKYHNDSLQALPALQELVASPQSGERWAAVFNQATRDDIYARARSQVSRQHRHRGAHQWPKDHYGEVWVRDSRETPSFDYTHAAMFHQLVSQRGW